jgi:hypothetical protein
MEQIGMEPLGSAGQIVEMDETYDGDKDIIKKRTIRGRAAHSSKRSIVSLVERGGSVRTFHVERADKETINSILAYGYGIYNVRNIILDSVTLPS